MLSTIGNFCWLGIVQRIHITLATCLLVTALVYGVLKILGGVGYSEKGEGYEKNLPPGSNTRHHRGDIASDSSTQNSRMRARKMTAAEAAEFLKKTIIPEVDFDKILLSDALKVLNEEIRKQTPDDQPRVRILLHPDYDETPSVRVIGDTELVRYRLMFDDSRLRKAPLDVLLKLICDQTNTEYWFYKGDFYLSPLVNDRGLGTYFYHAEELSRVQLANIDASQLSEKWNEIIGDHDYFGPKQGMDVMMTKKAREALLKGEIKLPRIDLDLKNVTPREAVRKIAEHSEGALILDEPNLLFNPFNEEKIMGSVCPSW